jgi:hypothetical protein
MLASQMAAVQMAMLRFASQIFEVEALAQQDSATRAFNQLARTFVTQMEALKRYRSRGDQNITVQHVSVSEGGQAIVGNVSQSPADPAPAKASSPHQLTHSKIAPMEPITESARKAVPVKRKSGK